MVLKTFLWLIFLSILITGCESREFIEQNTETPISDYDGFPDEIMEYHIEQQITNHHIFILTYFQTPFNGEFNAIQLNNKNLLEIWIRISPTGGRGIVYGELQPQEIDKVTTLLESLRSDWVLNKSKSGKNVLTISFPISNNYYVESCQDDSCSKEICQIFQIAEEVIKRQNRKIYLVCPIPE